MESALQEVCVWGGVWRGREKGWREGRKVRGSRRVGWGGEGVEIERWR